MYLTYAEYTAYGGQLDETSFTDLEFDKGFHNISVFDSTVKEFDYRNYALEKCKDIF